MLVIVAGANVLNLRLAGVFGIVTVFVWYCYGICFVAKDPFHVCFMLLGFK